MFETVQLLAGNQFVAARLLGADIRHSSLYAVAAFVGSFRRAQNQAMECPQQRFGQVIYRPSTRSRLDRTIASLHRQTLRPIEIIVVDDGSTELTRAPSRSGPRDGPGGHGDLPWHALRTQRGN